jgi:hypothetical protein
MSKKETPKIERKTYINGRLKGQYQGFESHQSYQNAFEKVYDLELVRGQVYAEEITKWDEVDKSQFINNEEFRLKLPKTIRVNLNDNGVLLQYDVELHDVRIISYQLGNHEEDREHTFGDITVNIVAYFVHDDELTDKEFKAFKRKEKEKEKPDGHPKVFISKEVKNRRGYQTTIKKSPSGKVFYSSSKIYGSGFEKFWRVVSTIFHYLLFALIFIPVLIAGWPVFAAIAGILLLFWILSLVLNFILGRRNWIWGFLGLLLGIFMLSNVLSLLRNKVIDQGQRAESIRPPSPKEPLEEKDQLIGGQEIKQNLHWQDYNSIAYQGTISIQTKDWFAAKNLRNNQPNKIYSAQDYNSIVQNIYLGNVSGMDGVYHMFDSIITATNPSKQQFAEIAVSCIQDIPYYLILDGTCEARDYPQGEYIHQYLLDNDACVDHIKYGLLGPLEFMATLHGDCDTRTLLLYTILKHYGYSVMMLVSQPLQHSILAIELPRVDGRYFTYRNRRFIWWETTMPNIPPGLIPNEHANPNLWQISLI